MYWVNTFDNDLYKRNQALEEIRVGKHKYVQRKNLKRQYWRKYLLKA